MTRERELPAALSSGDVAKILAICSRAVLVGGQALGGRRNGYDLAHMR